MKNRAFRKVAKTPSHQGCCEHLGFAELLADEITDNILPDPVTTVDILDICAINGIVMTKDTTGTASVTYTKALYGDAIPAEALDRTLQYRPEPDKTAAITKGALLAAKGAG